MIEAVRSGDPVPDYQLALSTLVPTSRGVEAVTHRVVGQSRPSVKLMDLYDGYARERQPSPATMKRWRPVIASLISHLGHDDANLITADDIIGWKEALARDGIAGRTIREVYLAAIKVVLGWSVENRKIAVNPATDVTVRVPKTVRLRERGFSVIEARTILKASLERGFSRISEEHARARRWIPWICAYSGARVGEIGQLRGCDFSKVDGVWALRITPEAGSTKSGTARWVPIHDHLLEQGILEMVTRVGIGPLFFDPSRARGGSDGNPHAKKVGERLAKWVRELGVNDPHVQPNHSWRHLFKTIARRAGIDPAARDAIQGHAPRTVGEEYGDWPVDVLAKAISAFPRFHT
ncbi:hypothetical protein [Sphingobium sp.]|uniref:hypothetical protein n=1 Tax=Sphingobium sp. TaxID=1912891 RepID=UPI002C16E88F|nr:hypothetical protein [Sphingobium sp.]HUD90817.1 hypothetical protein [Sphingobium sp.]